MDRAVLLIAGDFPPVGGAAVQRLLKFAQHLPRHGWRPVVLTTTPDPLRPRDPTLLQALAPETVVCRVRAPRLPGFRPWRLRRLMVDWLLGSDERCWWRPFASNRGRRLLQDGGVSAMISSSPPFSTHRVALDLRRAATRPWIADFRDPWVGNFGLRFPTAWHRRRALRLERQVVGSADRVLVVSESMRANLLGRHPDLEPGKVEVLPNGFDAEDFVALEPAALDPTKMWIVYAGSIHGDSATPFFRALRAAIDQGVPPEQLRVRLVGRFGRQVGRAIRSLGLDGLVEQVGSLPYRESLAQMLGADSLLLLIPNQPGAEVVLTTKLFEYLIAGKPILALVPPGAAADLIGRARAGSVVAPDDSAAIAAQIAAAHRRWHDREPVVAPVTAVVLGYERRQQARRLAAILEQLAAPPRRTGRRP
jgi:glycosyltransferase involved in cell wall biosynthesis